MEDYQALRGGHPPRDIRAELIRIGEMDRTPNRDRKPKILLNPRTGRKTITYPSETRPPEMRKTATRPSDTTTSVTRSPEISKSNTRPANFM